MNNMQRNTEILYTVMCVLIIIFLTLWFLCPRFIQEHELDYLPSHHKYWKDFWFQKTEESRNYRMIAFSKDDISVKVDQVIDVNGEDVRIKRNKTVLISDDKYITVVVYVEGDYAKYWEVSYDWIDGQPHPINKYTDPCQIPDDEWYYFEVNPGGWDSLKSIYIWDISPVDKLVACGNIQVLTEDYIKANIYLTYGIGTPKMSPKAGKNVKVIDREVETFFKDGVAVKQVVYDDLNFDGEFTDEEFITMTIQDMYGKVDLDKVETSEYSIDITKITP